MNGSFDCPCGWSRVILDDETVEDARIAHEGTVVHAIATRGRGVTRGRGGRPTARVTVATALHDLVAAARPHLSDPDVARAVEQAERSLAEERALTVGRVTRYRARRGLTKRR